MSAATTGTSACRARDRPSIATDASSPTTGTAATGRSLVEANLATVSTGGDGTEDFTNVRLAPRPDNEVGADAKIWVRLNNFEYVDANAGN